MINYFQAEYYNGFINKETNSFNCIQHIVSSGHGNTVLNVKHLSLHMKQQLIAQFCISSKTFIFSLEIQTRVLRLFL